MASWTEDELDKIGDAEELEIAPLRDDGTPRKPVTIWVVRVADNLYVRSYLGQEGKWYRNALVRHEGRILAGGVEKAVALVEVTGPAENDQVDAAYRVKYRRYPEDMAPMVEPKARAATLKLVPRG